MQWYGIQLKKETGILSLFECRIHGRHGTRWWRGTKLHGSPTTIKKTISSAQNTLALAGHYHSDTSKRFSIY